MKEVQSYSTVAKRCLSAVVSIFSTSEASASEVTIFDFLNPNGGNGGRDQQKEAQGSGVFVRESGLIVTNEHVVRKAVKIKVILTDRRDYRARVVLREKQYDLAVLQLLDEEGNDVTNVKFPTIPIGLGDECQVGDVVLAIGNPFGLRGTVTHGIISTVGRRFPQGNGNGQKASRINIPLIQTSAAINPGSSGGALVNLKGELIGVNQCIVAPAGGNVGLGFAVPANYIRPILFSIDGGHKTVQRPYVGMSLAEMQYPHEGIKIHRVLPNSPGKKAGICQGDILKRLDGVQINEVEKFLMRLNTKPVGSDVKISVLRDKKELQCVVNVGSWEERPKDELLTIKFEGELTPLDGVVCAQMGPTVNARMRLDMALTGVVVVGLPKSRENQWARKHLRVGDVFVAVNGRKIEKLEDIRPSLKEGENGKLTLTLERDDTVFQMSVKKARSPKRKSKL